MRGKRGASVDMRGRSNFVGYIQLYVLSGAAQGLGPPEVLLLFLQLSRQLPRCPRDAS